jgi:hypothetical protein
MHKAAIYERSDAGIFIGRRGAASFKRARFIGVPSAP